MFTKTNEPPPASYGLTWRDRLPGPVATLLRFPWWQFAIAIFAAVLLAKLINTPNARIIKALAGIAIFAVAYKTRPFYALCFIMLFMFFPFSIFVGSSTMIFVVLAATIYLARLTQKQVAPLQRTPIDLWVGLM
ncbi:MAG: hypothetical protein HKN21_08745, partial [Candidatus Eisenbacteria bacterium]|nr:hypothetical protein [Candidatus Eisenbacteria bacterium]